MGQYYNVLIKKHVIETVFEPAVDGEISGLKLMEHSWLGNNFCRAIASKLYRNPCRVAWVGDYSEDYELEELGIGKSVSEIFNDNCLGVSITDFHLDGLYLINSTKKIFLDLDKYQRKSTVNGRCIFPLSLLTAIGNDRGGGDFHDIDTNVGFSHVGTWAFDVIYIDNTIPDEYSYADIVFKEL